MFSLKTPGFFVMRTNFMSNLVSKAILLILLSTFTLWVRVDQPAWAEDVPSTDFEKIERKIIDERARVLQAYLEKYNSPLKYQAGNFVEAADKYNLDWRLVAAISGVESTFGKFIPGGYNAWGWGIYGNQTLYFKSWKDGIYTVSAGLRENYLNRGLTDPYSINRIYAASPAWGGHVSYFLQDMEKFENNDRLQNDQKLVAGTSANLTSK